MYCVQNILIIDPLNETGNSYVNAQAFYCIYNTFNIRSVSVS